MGPITEERLTAAGTGTSRLSRRMYIAVVGTGLFLTACQVIALPRFLGAEEFGLVAIAISVTQGFFQFGDLGFGRLSDETFRDEAQRGHLRMLSFTASSAVLLVVLMIGGIIYAGAGVDSALYAMIAAATAWVLCPTQLRAQVCEARGDEVGSALRHLLWQNAPKVGLIAGALLFRTAPGCLMGGLAGACLVAVPRVCSLRAAREIPALWRRWGPSLLAIVAPFVMAWSDTYFVAAQYGLATAAGYAVVYRILNAVSYFYLPFGSVLLSRLNRGEREATWLVPLLSLALCVPVLLGLAGGIVLWGGKVFPGIPISVGIVLPLVLMNVFANVSYLFGTTLSALGRFDRILLSNLVGAAVALSGHLIFTVRSSLPVAAVVSCSAVATAGLLQLAFVVPGWRTRVAVAGDVGRATS